MKMKWKKKNFVMYTSAMKSFRNNIVARVQQKALIFEHTYWCRKFQIFRQLFWLMPSSRKWNILVIEFQAYSGYEKIITSSTC